MYSRRDGPLGLVPLALDAVTAGLCPGWAVPVQLRRDLLCDAPGLALTLPAGPLIRWLPGPPGDVTGGLKQAVPG